MAKKIFISYRRDDARDMTARIRDRLASIFGARNVFMDVDNLMAGQRFDRELNTALERCDVLVAVIGSSWLDILREREAQNDRDYVREEIAGALGRDLIVIPVLADKAELPSSDALPEDIRELVFHQKHDVSYERFRRDVDDLAAAIKAVRRARGAATRSREWIGRTAAVAALLGILGGVVYYSIAKYLVPNSTENKAPVAANGRAVHDVIAKPQSLNRAVEPDIPASTTVSEPTSLEAYLKRREAWGTVSKAPLAKGGRQGSTQSGKFGSDPTSIAHQVCS